MLKRTLSIFLAAMMLLPTLAACSNGSTPVGNDTTAATINNDTVAPAETEPAETKFDPFAAFPEDLSYAGRTFTIHNGNTGTSWYTRVSVVSEEQTGEVINDAIYTRQRKVEDRFGVEIIEFESKSAAEDIRRAVQANTTDFDLSFINLMGAPTLASEGFLVDFYTIPEIQLDQPWWDQKAIEDMSIDHKLFYCTSAFDITRLDGIRTVYYNKELASQFELGNLYEMVDNGTWTIDKYTELATQVKGDLDGDNQATDQDRYGVVSYGELLIDTLVAGCGFKFIDKDENDLLVSNINSEAFYTAYEKIRHIMHDENIFWDVRVHKGSSGDRASEQIFLGNQALFYSECMAWTRVLREMEADFGVLPPPKLNEAQDRYYALTLNPWCFVVLNNNPDLEFTGNMLEALSAASYDTVVPAYVDITLTGKVARDEDTVRMLELVFDNLYYSIYLSEIITRNTVQSSLQGNRTNIASSLASMQKVVDRLLPKTNAKFTEMGE